MRVLATEGYNALKKLRRGLLPPFLLTVITILLVIALLFYSANQLNEYSRLSSEHLFQSVLTKETENLSRLTKDYSFWNDAVEKLIVNYDHGWLDSIFTEYLHETFTISRVVIIDSLNSRQISIYNGELEDTPPQDIDSPGFQTLIEQAINTDMEDPTPAIGILRLGGEIQIVSVAPLTPDINTDALDISKHYGLLVFTRAFNQTLLDEWESAFRFNNIALSTKAITRQNRADHDIRSPEDKWLAVISWEPELPGKIFMENTLPWITGLILVLLVLSALFISRINAQSGIADATLRQLSQTRKELDYLAYYDATTDLPNRTLALDRLQQTINVSQRHGNSTAILYVGLDDFKHVNDTRGHETGDNLLQMAALRIVECVRKEDTVARMGGDEFCIILADLKYEIDAETVSSKINEEFNKPFIINNENFFITASIGIATTSADTKSPGELFKLADMAMFKAKRSGKNRYAFFTQELNERVQEKARLIKHLRLAEKNNELSIAYQPIVNLKDSSIAGMEALLRWNNEELGSISPTVFIPLAESRSLIHSLGEWVIRQAIEDRKRFKTTFGNDFFLSINLSPLQFRDTTIIDLTRELCEAEDSDLPAIYYEITESILFENTPNSLEIMNQLNDMGIRISLDDFGVGYSSLGYLQHFPISTLKVDKTFISNLNRQDESEKLLIAIIAMANNLGLSIIVEGVENETQKQFLIDHGCKFAQGFFFSEPMPIEHFLDTQKATA